MMKRYKHSYVQNTRLRKTIGVMLIIASLAQSTATIIIQVARVCREVYEVATRADGPEVASRDKKRTNDKVKR